MSSPRRGELVWTVFDPSLGHEQRGRRPALVLSNDLYNARSGLMICMPITSRVKGYSQEVVLPEGLAIQGAILTSHVYTLDWRSRETETIGLIPPEVLATALQRLAVVILQ